MKRKLTSAPEKKKKQQPRKNSFTRIYEDSFNDQCIPLYIKDGDKELTITFNKGEKLKDFSKLPPLGGALVDGDDFRLIMFRTKDGVICMHANSTLMRHKYDRNANNSLWWYDYTVVLIHGPNSLLMDGRCIHNILDNMNNPYDVYRLNDQLYRVTFLTTLRETWRYTPNPVFKPGNGEVIFRVSRSEYDKYMTSMTPKVFYLKEISLLDDVFYLITKELIALWKHEWRGSDAGFVYFKPF